LYSITSTHALAVGHLPVIHKDPFARMLVAQAGFEGLLLLTGDEVMAKYPGPIRRIVGG
jgi:PIN domain nuclease of toxin-antitoxin system